MVGDVEDLHIHLTHPAACAAGGTLAFVHLQPVNGYLVAHAVKGPQGTQPFAKWPVEEHRQHCDPQQDAALPGEEPPQTGPDAGISQGQGDTALQDPGGT